MMKPVFEKKTPPMEEEELFESLNSVRDQIYKQLMEARDKVIMQVVEQVLGKGITLEKMKGRVRLINNSHVTDFLGVTIEIEDYVYGEMRCNTKDNNYTVEFIPCKPYLNKQGYIS